MVKNRRLTPRTLPRVQPLQAQANRRNRIRVLRERNRTNHIVHNKISHNGTSRRPPNCYFLSSTVGDNGELITRKFESAMVAGLSQSIESRLHKQQHSFSSVNIGCSHYVNVPVFEAGSSTHQSIDKANFVKQDQPAAGTDSYGETRRNFRFSVLSIFL
ncbi:hypothetical protein CCACVL1_01215 [Corchorus capsularis]|uniref:Uncharacterized protein n=1 Tax=Corchorus capsularis TaxID=210143 RepID=A0A1R3KL94_COCAP|nr:hypothetical protein CCACVL1_01215 [Corchorus capsularis]